MFNMLNKMISFISFLSLLLSSSSTPTQTMTPTLTPTTIPPTNAPLPATPPNCMIVLPAFPLSYTGLTTPFQLQTIDPAAPCDMRTFPAFVEAVIIDLDTHSLSVYQPLIINTGSTPLSPPIPFNMPQNSLVGLWFGSNGMSISLTPQTSIQQGMCVYNVGGITSKDTFGQFAHCNAVSFFETLKQLILKNVPLNPPIPPLGMANDGEPCLTTRDFALVDMDPSDNIVSMYLVDMATGKTAQNSVANAAANPNAVVLKNGSDNLLLATLDRIMGCKPYLVPNLVDLNNQLTGGKTSSMALDEIHAAIRQEKFYAYLPKGDPMVRINNMPNLNKLNAYRQGVFQPMVNSLNMAGTMEFCAHMTNIQLPRLQKNKELFIIQPSPDVAISNNLYGFLMNRFFASYTGLNCQALLDIPNPVTLIMANNLVTDAIVTFVPPISTGSNDPYLLSWDEYPEFVEPTTPPVPTTMIPTTMMPTTMMPTTSPTTMMPTTMMPTTSPTTMIPTTMMPTTSPTTMIPTTMMPTPRNKDDKEDENKDKNGGTQNNTVIVLSGITGGLLLAVGIYYFFNCTRKCKKGEEKQNETQVPLVEKVEKEKEGVKKEKEKDVKCKEVILNLSPLKTLKRSSSPRNSIHLPRV